MKVFQTFFTWVYQKNWEIDQLPYNKREYLFLAALISAMIFAVVIPSILALIFKDIYSGLPYLIFFLTIASFSAFRMPYISGKIENYMPEHIRRKKSAEKLKKEQQERNRQKQYKEIIREATKQNTDDWRIQYLNILGLDTDADSEEIKVAYRKLAMKWHPDRSRELNAEEKFKLIKTAYEKLT